VDLKNIDTHPDVKFNENLSRIQHIKTEYEEKNNSFFKTNKAELEELEEKESIYSKISNRQDISNGNKQAFKIYNNDISSNNRSSQLINLLTDQFKDANDESSLKVKNHLKKSTEEEIRFKKNTSENINTSERKLTPATPPLDINIAKNINGNILVESGFIHTSLKQAKSIIMKNSEVKLGSVIKQNDTQLCESNFNFSIAFASEEIEEFQIRYSQFFSEINHEQKIAFKLQDNILDYIKGFGPKVLIANDLQNNKMLAICCIQYDSLFDNYLRLLIKNIVCLEYEKFEIFASAFLKFILNNFFCEEIYIDLYYELKNGNFEVNSYILDILKKSLGFKWTKLENKIGERYQKMCIKVKQGENMNLNNNTNTIQSLIKGEVGSIVKYDSNKNIFSFSANENTNNSNYISKYDLKSTNMKKFKCSLEINSSSMLKLKNACELVAGFDPAAGGESNYCLNVENFEKNANYFLVLHSLLNANNNKDVNINGDLIKNLDFDKIKVCLNKT